MLDLAQTIHTWHQKNYPTETDSQALLAIGEEFGELDRVLLKQSGGIRGTWEEWEEWEAEKVKEVGDVMIASLEFAMRRLNRAAIERAVEAIGGRQTCYPIQHIPKAEQALHALAKYIGELRHQFTFSDNPHALHEAFHFLIVELDGFCQASNLNLIDCLVSRWATISKRDYEKNPFDGGRENE